MFDEVQTVCHYKGMLPNNRKLPAILSGLLVGLTMTTPFTLAKEPTGAAISAVSNRAGSVFALAHFGGAVSVWDGRALTLTRSFQTSAGEVIALSEHGSLLALVGAQQGKVQVFDTRTGKLVRELDTPGRLDALSFDPAGKELLIAGADRLPAQPGDKRGLVRYGPTRVLRSSLAGGTKVKVLAAGTVPLVGVQSSPSGVVALDRNGSLLSWTSGSEAKHQKLGGQGQALARSSDGTLLAGVDNRLHHIDAQGKSTPIPGIEVDRLSKISPTSSPHQVLLIGYEEVQLVDTKAGSSRGFISTGVAQSPRWAMTQPDQNRLVILGGYKVLWRTYDLKTGKPGSLRAVADTE